MDKKTMIIIETEEKETFKDKVAKHKTVILTGVGVVALGVGAYFGYRRFKIDKGTVNFMKSQVKINQLSHTINKEELGIIDKLIEEKLNLEIAVNDLTDEMYVIKKTLADGEIVEQAISKTENQITYLTGKLEKLLKSKETYPNDNDIINAIEKVKGKLRHLNFIKEIQLDMRDITNHFEE